MGLAHKSFRPHNNPSKPGCSTFWLERGVLVMPNLFLRPNQFGLLIMLAALHLPKRCTGLRDSFLISRLIRSCRLGIQNVLLNDHYLRDYFNSAVYFDGVEKRNRHVCVGRFLWRSEPIKCLPLHPLYKKEGRRLLFLQRIPFLRYLTSCRAGGCPWQRLFLGVGRSPRTPTQNGPGPRFY